MTQKQKVINRINEVGYVDNFWSIETKTSLRLGAIIFDLQKEGWEFHGEFKEGTKNFHYYPTKRPPEHPEPPKKKEPVGLFGEQKSITDHNDPA